MTKRKARPNGSATLHVAAAKSGDLTESTAPAGWTAEQRQKYESAIGRLIELTRARHRHDREWKPTRAKKSVEAVTAQIDAMIDTLHRPGNAQEAIKATHDSAVFWIGEDGRTREVDTGRANYDQIVQQLRFLRDSARNAAAAYPHPNKKRALPFAAAGLLHIRYHFKFPRPACSESGDEVRELARICEAAQIWLAPVTLRGAVAEALDEFSASACPADIVALIRST